MSPPASPLSSKWREAERGKKSDDSERRGREVVIRGREGPRARRKKRGSKGVVRVQQNAISICWRKKRRSNE